MSFEKAKLVDFKEIAITGSLIVVSFSVLFFSPVRQFSDSRYALLVSESLIHRKTFVLDDYFQHERFINPHSGRFRDDMSLELEWAGDHIYYQFPPGTSLLSLPFVGILNLMGLSATDRDGAYSQALEQRMQGILAAFLMALFSAVTYRTARNLLDRRWSVAAAIAATFGTQVWSTASRGMWAQTWEILLMSLILSILVRHEAGRGRLRPGVLASLAAWLYIVRPTGIVPLACLTIYSLGFGPALFVRYALAAGAWLAAFMLYSWSLFGSLLPSYYLRLERVGPETIWEGLAGNLYSPSRGILIYVPMTWFIAWLLIRYRQTVLHKRLACLAACVILMHLLVVASHVTWWGGHSFGARYTSCLVPWLGLLGMLGARARLDARAKKPDHSDRGGSIEIGAGVLLVVLSMTMNGLGAIRESGMSWNVAPANVDFHRDRLWDWRQPQFLATLAWPLPWHYPELGDRGRIEVGSQAAESFLWGGWSNAEGSERWTTETRATVLFSCSGSAPKQLRIKLRPNLLEGKLPRQRMRLFLNGVRIGQRVLRHPKPSVEEFAIPIGLIQERNRLRLQLPDAASEFELGTGQDRRKLGAAVCWIDMNLDLIESD